MNPSEVQSYLNTFVNFESQLDRLGPKHFTLDRIREFLDLAGGPARNLKIIHIAGTKGKGSTSAFLARILQEAGFKVGLYTSPHLHRLNERIRILSQDNISSKDPFSGSISDHSLGIVLTYLRPFAADIQNEGHIITYFEVLTVAALVHFAHSKVDIVILETGLGGRLDATNAPDSSIAVLTPVSMDHMSILGSTLKEIASEKAGIIKKSQQQVIIAPQEPEVMDVLLHRCKEFGIRPIVVDMKKYENLKTVLKGQHQKINAATAIETAVVLRQKGFKISEETITEGLKHVIWPGRFEILSKNPDVVVDCAHNGASAQSLAQTLMEEYPKRRVILVLGVSKDKDVMAICQALEKNVGFVILTKAPHPRAHAFNKSEVRNYFGEKPYEIIESIPQALERAMQIANPQDVILVTGSIFVVAEARELKACTNTKV